MHVLERPVPPPDARATYAAHEWGHVDLFLPPGEETRPPAILIHGGFWRARYDRLHLRVLAAALARGGRRVAVPEYRRVGNPGGGWPGSLEDVMEVLAVVPHQLGVAPGEVTLAGHSAGAHLAVLAAARATQPPARLVSLAGVLDVAAAHAARLSDGAVAGFLGVPAPAGEAIEEIDPLVQPLPECDITLVHGTRDVDVPWQHSAAFARRSERIDLVLLEADHYDVIDPLAPTFPAVQAAFDGGRR
ncbi:alpha/beta hydrolase family protein [Microbacterium album]|uniref:Lipase/esterase n=1 Tax=Microbacterium album TaxID=2053191 RepID=A0A917IGF3_9MICO|nr:alpha/beta hydrolase [Microbacterium album]GGH43127.1 putative lipase/esterase [Microbacterium album]